MSCEPDTGFEPAASDLQDRRSSQQAHPALPYDHNDGAGREQLSTSNFTEPVARQRLRSAFQREATCVVSTCGNKLPVMCVTSKRPILRARVSTPREAAVIWDSTERRHGVAGVVAVGATVAMNGRE